MAPRKWRALGFARRRRVARHRPENGHPLRIAVGGNDLKSERFDRLATNRCIHELNRVHDGSLLAAARQCGLHLQNTSGISRRHHIGLKWSNELSLAVSQFIGGVGLDEIGEFPGATADLGFRGFRELQLRDAWKQSSRMRTNVLCTLPVWCI